MQFLSDIPEQFIQFLLVLLFSLLIGLEQRRLQTEKDSLAVFGTDRTFTFIGILGFILYLLDPKFYSLFLAGFIILAGLLGVFYFRKIQSGSYGMTNIVVALITYCLAPVVATQPRWLSILIVVAVLILVELKDYFIEFSARFQKEEFITLAKFLIIIGVVLPILPRESLFTFIDLTAYDVWLALVIVSSISYASYLLHKFVFPGSGVVLSGILGGLYSSTAVTLVLSRRSREEKRADNQYASAIVFATAMMYVRIIILLLIFNMKLAVVLLPYVMILMFLSVAVGIAMFYLKRPSAEPAISDSSTKNPLELKMAFLFTFLFVLLSVITYFTIDFYGARGLNILSYVVGFTDIDPYLLNLFRSETHIDLLMIAKASLQAVFSNNILKALCTVFLADAWTRKYVLPGMGVITLVNLVMIFFV